jgi:hypothetical protein
MGRSEYSYINLPRKRKDYEYDIRRRWRETIEPMEDEFWAMFDSHARIE